MNELRRRRGQRTTRTFAAVMAGILGVLPTDAPGDELADLRARVEVLERLVTQLQGRLQPHDAVAAPRDENAAAAADRSEGFEVRTSDGASTVRLRGLLHFDARYYADDVTSATSDAWVLRRARPILQASLGNFGEVGFTPEFGGGGSTILDAFLSVRVSPWLRLTAGKFKVPVGLERIMSAADLRFIERGLPTALVPNRDLGLQLHGELAEGVFGYSVGYFNGVNDGGSSEGNVPTPDAENDTSGDWAARFFVQPFRNQRRSALQGLGLGFGATYVNTTGNPTVSLLSAFRTPGQQTFFEYRDGVFADGERLRLAPQLYYYLGPLGILGEVVEVSQDVSRDDPTAGARSEDLRSRAWQLQFAWFVTGEDEKFKGAVEPIAPFSLDGRAWGALEIVARYHELDIDNDAFDSAANSFADPAVAASRASAIGIGINWYLNEYYKLSLNYDRTWFDGGAPNRAERADEEFLSGRFAVTF